MFTQAHFNTNGIRVICVARVSKLGKSGVVWAWLVRWRCGDLAWASPTRICWGEQVHFHNVIRLQGSRIWGPSWPTDPTVGARHWIARGVAPGMDEWHAQEAVGDA